MKASPLFNTVLLTLIVAFIQVPVLGQNILLDTILNKFDAYRRENLQEKIYLHTDRASYLTGETLWFKAYVTDGSLHQPLALSGVAYVEILDGSDQAIIQTKISLQNGSGDGSIYLPASITSGNYHLRAYTSWMKNYDESFFFHKTITILNTFKNPEPALSSSKPQTDIQFFPEGGNLVSGVKSKVAFRAVNETGAGIDFEGFLLNNQNDTVSTFRPTKFGIGNLTFTPFHDRSYHAVIKQKNGQVITVKFPSVLNHGYSMFVFDSLTDKLAIQVNANLSEDQNPLVYIFVHARQLVVRAEAKQLQANTTLQLLNKKDLPEGITHITIFDSNLNPVCERLYFKKPDHLVIKASTDHERFVTRRRVSLDIQTSHADKPTSASLSVSIYREDSIQKNTSRIDEFMWLTSELQGQVESPAYYFGLAPEINQAVDNLMLTHGWRRFRWSDVLNRKKTEVNFIPEQSGHIIRGLVKDNNGQPSNGVVTFLSSPGKAIRLYVSRSNPKGEVLFDMRDFYGSRKIIIQANPTFDSTYTFEVVSPFSEQDSHWPLPVLILDPSSEKSILMRSVALQVQDIYNLKEPMLPPADSMRFYGNANETYYLDSYTRFPVMEEVMREYVPGVWVRKRKDGFHFLVLDKVNGRVFDETPLVLIDGVPIFDEDEIMSFDPLKIKKLEVMTRNYYLGPFRFPGVVSYSTYTNDLADFQLQPRSIKLNYEGLQLEREFYSPRYESPTQRESRIPDQRTLLYWNPNVITGPDGKQQIQFFTSDVPGEYTVVLEGITTDGHVGTTSKNFTVNAVRN